MGDRENAGGPPQGGDASPGGTPPQGAQNQPPNQPPPGLPDESPVVRLHYDSDELSGVLGERLLGYVSVQLLFLDVPVKGVKLTIANADGEAQIPDPDWAAKQSWQANSPNMTTDDNGCCTLGKQVPIGSYACTIEYQDPAPVTTVEDPQRPFVLVLPIGRPYNDIYVRPPEPQGGDGGAVIFHSDEVGGVDEDVVVLHMGNQQNDGGGGQA